MIIAREDRLALKTVLCKTSVPRRGRFQPLLESAYAREEVAMAGEPVMMSSSRAGLVLPTIW